ncbi:cation/calcium exchanger 1-like [Macadamia integrifolia]|uniref:cation/calcium exchanger 1-like n=1 Tax=Macadamia integrifolia TaxID=60698 RepID=UPI001C4EFD24|nr:cation/calcium exchanger 1-like [Macadamia integrifolia]
MASLVSLIQGKEFYLFINISFLLLLSFYLISNPHFLDQSKRSSSNISSFMFLNESYHDDGCSSLHRYHDYKAKCLYLRSDKGCRPEGYIDYLQLFYCTCGRYPVFGYTVLVLWLLVLFYLLGNTAANYFCSSLEQLSTLLKLSPTIAGVTLLSLGNGAPDVFASIVSFMGTGAGAGEVGLNSVLGGAFFISTIVVGIISISVGPHQISIDKSSFIRDVVFFLLVLSSLLLILLAGKIDVWGAITFASLYIVYVLVVSTTHWCRKEERKMNLFPRPPILPISRNLFEHETEGSEELGYPLLAYIDDEKINSNEEGRLEDGDQKQRTRWFNLGSPTCYYFHRSLLILELPLYLPRRLTIPVVSEERWSKPLAVISVTLAPFLLAALWNSQRRDMGSKRGLVIYVIGGLAGITFGVLAFLTTEDSNPPRKYLLPWLAGGFLMSIIWTYIIAEELVALLVSLGHVFGINPSSLGLTVLAWGNSLGDLIANVAMTVNGGPDGVQVAISGCYAGPIFNTLMGLGLSLTFSAWFSYPSSFVIPKDSSLYETVGFLISGLLWALVILPKKNMRIDRTLGAGLLAIYICFLSLRLARATGLLQLHASAFSLGP